MFELTVKTLDGRDHSFTLPEEVTVSELKQQIARSLSIPAHEQRLIFRGKVLRDDFVLKAGEMDRKVLHLVTRPPPSQIPSQDEIVTAMPPEGAQADSGVYIGEINISSFISPNRVQEIVRQVMEQIGVGEDDANLTVTDRGRGIEIQIDLGSSQDMLARRDVNQRLHNIREMISNMSRLLEELEQTNAAAADTIPVFSPCPYTPGGEMQNPIGMPADASGTELSQPSGSSSQDFSQSVYEYDSILHDFNILNQRLSRFIGLYGEQVNRTTQSSLSPPSAQEQMLLTQIPFLLHLMSHIYHNISDLAFVGPSADRQASVSVNPSSSQEQQSPDRSMGRNQNAVTIELNQNAHQTGQPPSGSTPFQQQIMSAITEAINPILGLQQQQRASGARQPAPGTIVLNHVIAQIVEDDENGPRSAPTAGGTRFRIESPQRPFARSMVVTTNRPLNSRTAPAAYPPISAAAGYNPFAAYYQRMAPPPSSMFDYHVPYPMMNYTHYHGGAAAAAAPSYLPCSQQHVSPVMYPQMMRPSFYYYPQAAPQIRINQTRPSLFIRPGAPAYMAEHVAPVLSARQRMMSNAAAAAAAATDSMRSADNRQQTTQPGADPYLPCFSGFHDPLRWNREHPQRGHTILSPPEQMIADILSQLLPPLFSSGRERVQVLIGSGSSAPAAAPDNPPAAVASNPTTAPQVPRPQPVSDPPAASPAAPAPRQADEENAQIPTSETFRQLAEIIESGQHHRPAGGGELADMTLANVLGRLMDPARPERSQDVFEESMRLITTNLTFSNLLELLDGNARQSEFANCLQRLADFLSQVKIDSNGHERYRAYYLARQFADSLLRSLSLDLSRMRTRRGISAVRSIQAFVRYSSFRIITCLLSAEPDQQVRNEKLCDQIKSICAQIGPLLREIFVDVDELLRRLQSGQMRTVFQGVPRQLLPLIELLARAMPRYVNELSSENDQDDVERYIVLEDDVALSGDEGLLPIVEIDRMQFRKAPVPRAKSEAYMSMIPYKRRRAGRYAVNTTNAQEIHRVILQRVGDILTEENDATHPPMRRSILQSIQQDADDNLTASFRQKLRSLLRERVQSDEDFHTLRERFPHLRRLFE